MDVREIDWGVCGLDSTGSGQGPVAGCCECGDEPSGSCATELVVVGCVKKLMQNDARKTCWGTFFRVGRITLRGMLGRLQGGSDENFPEKFKSENFLENFPENFPFFYKDS
jgi:hypothetical protein